MLVEDIELTLSHTGLGTLHESALMMLFGTVHSHALMQGTNRSIRTITDANGAVLYPGYYFTHLKVPSGRPLHKFQVWDQAKIGVDVKTFGGILLQSDYAFGAKDDDISDVTKWTGGNLITLHAGSTFIVDGKMGEPAPAMPKEGAIAALTKIAKQPDALERFRIVRSRGRVLSDFRSTMQPKPPFSIDVEMDRDIKAGHGIMFASFIALLGSAERLFLTKHLWPPLPLALVDTSAIIERETFFLANMRQAGTINVDIRASLSPGVPGDTLSAATLTLLTELYDASTGEQLIASHARREFLIPRAEQGLRVQVERALEHHGKNA